MGSAGGRTRDRLGRANTRLGIGLALLPVLSAVPLASNRASWWLLWTAAVALAALLHFVRSSLSEPGRALRAAALAGPLLLALAVPLYALLQALPLAGALPAALVAMPEGLSDLRGASLSLLPEASLLGALRLAGYLLFLVLVLEVSARRERVALLSRLLFMGLVLHAAWALAALRLMGDVAPWGDKTAYLGMATGTFVNRNSLATFLGMGLVLGAALVGRRLEEPQTRRTRPASLPERLGSEGILVLTGMLVLAVALLATQSRLGLVATLGGLATALALLRPPARGGAGARAAGALGLVLAAAALIALGGAGSLERFLFLDSDGGSRLALYRQVVGLIAIRPLTGFGLDAFPVAFEAVRGPPLGGPAFFEMAHDTYLGLWAELGLVAGSVPPVALAWCGAILLRRRRQAAGASAPAAGALGVLVLAALHSLGDFSLEIPANVYLFLAILGLGLGTRPAEDPTARAARVPPGGPHGLSRPAPGPVAPAAPSGLVFGPLPTDPGTSPRPSGAARAEAGR